MGARVMNVLASARDYVSRGLPVLPLHGAVGDGRLVCSCGKANCDKPAKHPFGRLAPNGLRNATLDKTMITRWFECYPQLNVGVLTGNVVALDIDPRKGGDESLRALEAKQGALPTTWRVLTGGGGEHIFFAPPPGSEIRNSESVVGTGIDVRGVGGYVVGVGSRHVSGHSYEWSVDHHPDDVPLAPMPAWLAELTITRPKTRAAQASEWRHLFSSTIGEGA